MKNYLAWAGQAVLYAAFAIFIGVFSHWPVYEVNPPGDAQIKVSFVHHGQRVAECRKRTPEELAKLPPNMRAPMDCSRQRSPVAIEVDVDGVNVLRHVAAPSGLSRDGLSTVYRRLNIPAGEHRIEVRMNDNARVTGFTHERKATVNLKPAQILVIDFDSQHSVITLT